MYYQEVIQAIKQNKIEPIYLVHGTESFLIDQFLETILGQHGSVDDMDIAHLDLEEVTITEVLDEANMFSFFADKRIIIVDNASFVSGQSKIKLQKSEEEFLNNYLKEPNPSSLLIFLTRTDSMDKRRKVNKLFLKETVIVDVHPLNEREVDAYIRHYLKGSDLKFSRQSLDELLIRVDYQLTSLMGEIEKLTTYALSGMPLSVDVIRKLVPRTLETDVFELTNAIASKQIKKAIQIYQDLILMKNEPIGLHALLVSQFRLMIQVKLLSQKGILGGQIADQLGVHPYRVKLAQAGVAQTSLQQLFDLYADFAEVDYKMKIGQGIKETYFYILLTKLMQL